MKEHPILFSAPMVRAMLADRKFVTRRLDPSWMKVKKGDRLWVKEGWRPTQENSDQIIVRYYADGDVRRFSTSGIPADWKMPKAAKTGQVTCLFMPRWVSRILLECEEDTRAERLMDVTEAEAIAEGIVPDVVNAITRFVDLWHSIHNKPGERWEDNPTVYRVGRFHRV